MDPILNGKTVKVCRSDMETVFVVLVSYHILLCRPTNHNTVQRAEWKNVEMIQRAFLQHIT